MSAIERKINLDPNKWWSDKEVITVRDFDCPICKGKGSITNYPAPWGKNIIVGECDRCKGSGLLCAKVTIEWVAKVEKGK